MVEISRRGFCAGTLLLAAPAFAYSSAHEEYRVEIRRDAFGVPYIRGNSDAACVYGLGYAQAEDGFEHLEDNVLRAIGRASEVHGEKTFDDDRLVRALEIPRLAREEFDRAPAAMREVYLAYHAGLQRYVKDTGARFQLLEAFEPWHPLALIRYKYHVLEFLGYAGLRPQDVQFGTEGIPERPNGSNAWAIAPSKSASGKAMLLINPHVGFFGPARYYECSLQSDEGLHFHGTGRYGFPLPYMGHNQHLGWANTDNYPDFCDLYTEYFDVPGDPLAYRYGNGHRRATRWHESVRVKNGNDVETRDVAFNKTHHGPILGSKKGKPVAARLAKLEEGGWYDQCYAMLRAKSFSEFRAALAPCAIPYMNIVYADREGNIFYAYNAAVPVRSEAFDWREPVDGSNPRTEWRGYHAFSDLPQLLNPASGYIQNCNSSPFATTSGAVPQGPFPAYMIGPETDNPRAKVSREILEETRTFTFEEWTKAATDTRLYVAREGVREIAEAWNALPSGDARREELRPIVEALRGWDGRAEIDSIPATIFIQWYSRRGRPGAAAPEQVLKWLEEARDELVAAWGDWRVPWGDINRLQDLHWSGDGKFDDTRPSYAVRGAPGWLGVVFNFYTDEPQGTKSRYGRLGNSYVSVVEFGDTPDARSIMVLGQAQDATSPHRTDQAALYAAGKFKPVWTIPADVAANTRSTSSFRIPPASE